MKRIISILMTAVLVSSLFVQSVFAEPIIIDGVEHDSSEYTAEELAVFEQFRRYDGVIRFSSEELENIGKEPTDEPDDDVDVSNPVLDDLDIDDYYNNGWSSEEAGDYVAKDEYVFVSRFQLAIDLNLYLKTMTADSEGEFNGDKSFTADDLDIMVRRLNELTGVQITFEKKQGILTDDDVADVLYKYLEAGYVKDESVKFELTNGIGSNDENGITREEAAKMLENLLNQTVYDVKLDKYADGSYANLSKEEIELMQILKLDKIKGTVTANSVTNISSSLKPNEGEIEINKIKYSVLSDDFDDFLGRNVDCYIYYGEDETFAVAMQAGSKDKYISGEPKDIVDMSATEIEIDDGARGKTYKLDSNVNVIFNGRYNGSLDGIGITKNYAGDDPNKIAFISEYADSFAVNDLNNDGKYDVIFVNSYLNSKVTAKSSNIMTVEGYAQQIDFESYKTVKIYKGVNKAAVGDIAANDVVSIAENGDLITVYISTKKAVSGKVTKLDQDGIMIDSQTEMFYLAPNCTNDILVGETGTFYISHFNKIVLTEPGSLSGRTYGYMTEIAYDSFTQESKIRMYAISGASGSWKDFKLAKKIDFYDGASIADPANANYQVVAQRLDRSKVVAALQGTKQLISYDINAKDEVTKIETAMLITNPDRIISEKVFHKEVVEERIRMYNGGWCGGVYTFTNDSKAFNIPSDKDNEKGYCYVGNYFRDGGMTVGTEIYDATALGFLGGVTLVYADNTPRMSSDAKTVAIADIEEAYDEATEEIMLKITGNDGMVYTVAGDLEPYVDGGLGYIENQQTQYNVATAADLKLGDLIGIATSQADAKLIEKFIFYARLSELNGNYFTDGTEGKGPAQDTYWWIPAGLRYGKCVGTDAAHRFMVIDCGVYKKLPVYCHENATPVYIYDRSARNNNFTKVTSKDIMEGDDIISYSTLYAVNSGIIILK